MSRIATLLFLLAASAGTTAQSTDSAAADDRVASIRKLVSQDSGNITALEPSTQGNGSVFIGYSSGTVLRCDSARMCDELIGTPNTAVQRIAVSKKGASETVWVSYNQGVLYQCVETQCTRLVTDNR